MTSTRRTREDPPGDASQPRARSWRPFFVIAVATLGASIVALIAVVVSSTCGSDSNPAAVPGTLTAAAGGSAGPGKPAGTPTPTVIGADGFPILSCGDILVPLGKQTELAEDCVPDDLVKLPDDLSFVVDLPIVLRKEAADAFVELAAAARQDRFALKVRSAYRSYFDQVRTFDANVAAGGLEYAERTSARAGHSEHQLGTVADVTSASNNFALEGFETTPDARWLADNSWKYGFIISYPDGKEDVTGYAYEAWHIRYVGKDVATAVHESGLTLIEYLSQHH